MLPDMTQAPPVQNVTAQTLDWFTFESQMRRLVIDIIEPTVKLAHSQVNDIITLNETSQKVISKLDELEFIV